MTHSYINASTNAHGARVHWYTFDKIWKMNEYILKILSYQTNCQCVSPTNLISISPTWTPHETLNRVHLETLSNVNFLPFFVWLFLSVSLTLKQEWHKMLRNIYLEQNQLDRIGELIFLLRFQINSFEMCNSFASIYVYVVHQRGKSYE